MDAALNLKIANCDFEKLFAKMGYTFFTKGDYNLNIIGIRNMTTPIQRDTFNDAMVIIYKEKGNWKKEIFEITTDPSLKFLKAPSNVNGTAILVPGQYRSTYKIDYHNGKYLALCQRLKPVKVYRDKNRDNKLDMNPATIQTGMFGINLHHASASYDSDTIGLYSAGCQVYHHMKDFNRMMHLANIAKNIYGNSFTYTLITSNDL